MQDDQENFPKFAIQSDRNSENLELMISCDFVQQFDQLNVNRKFWKNFQVTGLHSGV
jgi:hypothetical protein